MDVCMFQCLKLQVTLNICVFVRILTVHSLIADCEIFHVKCLFEVITIGKEVIGLYRRLNFFFTCYYVGTSSFVYRTFRLFYSGKINSTESLICIRNWRYLSSNIVVKLCIWRINDFSTFVNLLLLIQSLNCVCRETP